MSRAVVTCPGSGRPEALRKVVRDMPSERAVLVIRWAKAVSLPAIFSPMATATSFAESVITALIASSILIVWAGLRPSLVGGRPEALREIESSLSSVRWPASSS